MSTSLTVYSQLSRRRFLEYVGAAACAGVWTAFPSRVFAYAPIHYDYGAIPDNFGRRQILAQAMSILHNRFRDPRVVQNVYRYLRGGAFLAPGTLDSANVRPTRENESLLLDTQLAVLRNARRDEQPWFPKVTFVPADYDDRAWAWGRTGLVKVRMQRTDFGTIEGEFRVELSLRYLGGGGRQSDPTMWASIIAHEMLHNLGHKHPQTGTADDYRDHWQINVFTRAVYCDGTYQQRSIVPGFV